MHKDTQLMCVWPTMPLEIRAANITRGLLERLIWVTADLASEQASL